MKNVNIITLKAAHDFARKDTKNKVSKLSELQELCYPKAPPRQHWSFFGNPRVIRDCFHG